jgi:hypothetical protein
LFRVSAVFLVKRQGVYISRLYESWKIMVVEMCIGWGGDQVLNRGEIEKDPSKTINDKAGVL